MLRASTESIRGLCVQIPSDQVKDLACSRLINLAVKNYSSDIPIQLRDCRIDHPLRPMLSITNQ